MSLPEDKLNDLKAFIAAQDSMLIAYSGGTDSSLLSVISKEILGDKLLCVLIDSPLVPRRDVERAHELANRFSINLKVVNFDPFQIPEIGNNPEDRCYHCKKKICHTLKQIAESKGIKTIVDGTNLSDLGEYRPGNKATEEEGILHPFVEAGINKEDVRRIAKEMDLEFWNVPSSACLASRIPYNEKLDLDKLSIIEAGEIILYREGFRQCRMRLHNEGKIARIEIPKNDIPDLVSKMDRIMPELRKLDVSYITLDLEGYRTGSFDKKE
ncbi:uncharacterized protein J2755_001193 [Methanohalophilus levihalophilus]|uniref:ATP-dependent sacrificial sulfur transferase LarE n=1 Tax=Methanohalophilus levihalophilus TaxID=1431282 RepID=UPI001AE26949|nr:ATP-dependent sacrificial sulfur transferase LarE [Methanohalophilus levihalophilus]MBP2030259.1 uncharacterized protein [Methanohalophilus levihalophilus]